MVTQPFFKRTYLEITNICNQTCPFCPQTQRKAEFLTFSNFKLILNKLQGHTEHLYFHVLGEPLLHPKLTLFLAEANQQGFKVNLVTNGAAISELGHSLLNQRALRQISFSLHSLAHQGQELTQERTKQILDFVDLAQNTPLYLSLRLWTGGIEHNQLVLKAISEHFALSNLGEQLVNNPKKGLRLRERVFLNPAEEFLWPSLNAPVQPDPAFCHGLKQQIAILVDGTIVPCCLDGEGVVSLGNIYEKNLPEIYTAEKTQKILAGFVRGEAVEELCQRCGYRTRFSKTQ